MKPRPDKTRVLLLLGAYCLTALAAQAEEPCQPLTDKKRIITKVFSVGPQDKLFIFNQFGEVRVNLWDRNEVRAEVIITGSGEDEAEAKQFLDQVEIRDSRVGNQLRLETVCERKPGNASGGAGTSTAWAWADWGGRNGRKEASSQRGVRINYQVFLPRYLPLEVSGSFNNSFIPDFSAALLIQAKYGNVSAGRLTGTALKDIRVQYGEAVIKAMERGKLDIEYSKLQLEKATDLELDNKFGSVQIGEVDRLTGDLSYCSGQIEALNESVKLRLQYLHNFRFPQLLRTLKNLDIQSNCSDLRLPVSGETGLDFNITVNYADFGFPGGRVTLTHKSEGREDGRPSVRKTYQGKVGKGGGTVRIVSNYGTVRFVE